MNATKLTESSVPLADTQRAIIEAAERRGYERALAERDADARDAALDGLVDRIAEAIRDGAGLAECDPPWESLGEERRAPWRADAKRALSVIKDFLTAERGAGVGGPDAQQPAAAVDEAAVWRVIAELRAYNPAADEYKGAHIHKVWAMELAAAIATQQQEKCQ